MYISKSSLRGLYEYWCSNNQELPIDLQEFRASLAQKGIFETTRMIKDTGKREIIYKGICQA